MVRLRFVWVSLAVMVALVLLWGCTGDADRPLPEAAAPAAESAVDGAVGDLGGSTPGARAASVRPGVSQPGPALGGTGSAGWVEDSGWAAESHFAGSAWQRVGVPLPLGPGQLDGTRIGAGAQDAAGALWKGNLLSDIYDHEGEILDLCVPVEAVAVLTGGWRWPLDAETARDIRLLQDELDCDGDGVKPPPLYGYERGRYSYVRDEIDPVRVDFATRPEAIAYKERYERHLPRRYTHTVPNGAVPIGLNLCQREYCLRNGDWLAIEYSDVDAPVDEVRVLAGTLSLRDRTLRGLVRNWSRDLWAYRVTVTAAGRTWEWPLSMQPGEAAPFEFENWTGGTDPFAVDYAVTAQMSPDVDRSRFLEIGEFPTLTRDRFHDELPQEIIDTLPAGTEALSHFHANYVYADSHPSLFRLDPDRKADEWGFVLPIPEFELLAFSASIDSYGRLIEVSQPAPTYPYGGYYPDGTRDPTPKLVSFIPNARGLGVFRVITRGSYVWVGGADTAPALR